MCVCVCVCVCVLGNVYMVALAQNNNTYTSFKTYTFINLYII